MKHKEKPQILKCPYCGRTAVLRKASDIYEKALDEYLYVCSGYLCRCSLRPSSLQGNSGSWGFAPQTNRSPSDIRFDLEA